jgi:voltage-gated potassium channel
VRVYDARAQGSSGLGANSLCVSSRFDTRLELWYERLSLPRAIATVIAVAMVLVLIAGVLARIVEGETFTSLGLAYWWSVETVTTVGYGDVVPVTPAGRIVGTMLMLTGISLIPTLTGLIVSTLLYKHRRAEQDRLEELEGEQIAILARIEQRLERLEQPR